MPQAPDDTDHAHLAVGSENNFEQHLALELQPSGLLGVKRTRLIQNHHRLHRRGSLRRPSLGRFRLRAGIAEAALLDSAAAACSALSGWDGDAIAKAGAGDGAADAVRPAGAVAVAGAAGQVVRASLRDVAALVGIALAGQAVGIAEPAGLDLVDGSVHLCLRGAAGGEHAG